MVVPELFTPPGLAPAPPASAPPWEAPVEDSAGPAVLIDGTPSSAPEPAGLTDGTLSAGSVPAAGVNAGVAAMERCGSLLVLGSRVLESAETFFDPALLAQLDAALAHELANHARQDAEAAVKEFAAAVREHQDAGLLASLRERAGRTQRDALKAGERAAQATTVVEALGGVPTALGFDHAAVDACSPATLVDLITTLERAKNAMAAVQAQVQALFTAQQRLAQARDGVPQKRLGQGIAQQLGLARAESPHRGRQLCELAEVLVREMPHTMNAFTSGVLSEYRATVMAAETVFLSRTDRARVDEDICGPASGSRAGSMGTAELRAAARKAAYALDPESFIKRHHKAVGDRYVSLRPAPDGMTFLTALIPLKQGVRILNTLTKVAASARAAGDDRGKGQIMADALMHRLIHHTPCDTGAGTLGDHRGTPTPTGNTGNGTHNDGGKGADDTPASDNKATADSDGTPAPGNTGGGFDSPTNGGAGEPWCTAVGEPEVALGLVMTDRALFGTSTEPAVLVGYEPIPAALARDMILNNHNGNSDSDSDKNGKGNGSGGSPGKDKAKANNGGGGGSRVWLKRLFTHPDSNALLAMDSRSRLFPEGLKEFLRIRDQRCQSPYCDAPIRDYDHIKAYAAGGPTTSGNGQGLCTACNQAKEAPGWAFKRDTGTETGEPATHITTPTGHHYITTAPPLPGPERKHHSTRRR